jgi:dGTPase
MIDYSDAEIPRNLRRYTKPSVQEGDSRNPAQKDKDRIIYTSAFRRLAEVTQVASPSDAHVFHNRLTHSLQVAQVGRSLAEHLRADPEACDAIGGIDPDTVEAACLAHDLGHPLFGHTAEELLNTLVGSKAGGFEGNAQSFRIVTKLAFKSTKHAGLDLTAATLAAILKYPWLNGQNKKKPHKWGAYGSESKDFEFARRVGPPQKLARSPEAELMDWADDVTYSVHDLEDFFRAGRIPVHLLARASENLERQRFFDDVYRRRVGDKSFAKRAVMEEAFANILAIFWRIYEPYSGTRERRSRLRYFTSQLIDRYVNGVLIDKKKKTVDINPEYEKEVAILKELTWTYVIEAPGQGLQREGQRSVVKRLFEVYSDAALTEKKWSIFPPYYREELRGSISASAKTRSVVDLIAGMTEPQAIDAYRQIIGAWTSQSLEDVVR